MRILIFLPSLELGGAERQAILLAKHLSQKGHKIMVYGFGQGGKVIQLCQEKGISCKAVDFPFAGRTVFGKAWRIALLCSNLFRAKPDVILSYCMSSNVIMSMLWPWVRARACIWGQRDAGLDDLYVSLFQGVTNLPSCFVSNSIAGKHFLSSLGVCQPIYHIPNAVNLPAPVKSRYAWRERLGIPADTLIVTMIANLSQHKAHDLLLHAWAIACASSGFPSNAILVLAGRHDEKANFLLALAQSLHIADRVIFTGPVDDVSGLLHASDCGVFSSKREGLPNGVLEAMQAGLPMVALDITGTREALGEDSKNILVSDLTPRALSAALCQMLSDPDLRQAAGSANRHRIAEKFTPEVMFAAYEALLDDLPAPPTNYRTRAFRTLISGLCRMLPGSARALYRRGKSCLSTARRHMDRIQARCISRDSKGRVPDSPRIGIAVLVHNRAEYLKPCLESLFATDLEGLNVTFLLHDDGSSDPSVRSILEEPREQSIIHRFYKDKGGNSWGAAFNSAMRELRRIGDFDILISCDSDALFHPQWLRKTLPIFAWAKANHRDHRLGPFSPFNSSDIEFHRVIGEYDSPYGGYLVKEQMGALVYCWSREDFDRWGDFEEHRDDETQKTQEFLARKIRNFCSKQSYVEHLGQNSVLNQWRPTPVRRAVYGLDLTTIPGWPASLEQANTLGYFREVIGLPICNPAPSSQLKVDVLVPAVGKDIPVLPVALQGILRNLCHPLGEIYVVAPRQDIPALRQAVGGLGVRIVDEREALPCPRESIVYAPCGMDRSGWLAQQLIKLNGAALSSQMNFMVIDSDTVLVRKQVFEREGRNTILLAEEYHAPYYEAFLRLFGYATNNFLSCVSHMMLFSRDFLLEMLNEIESRWGVSWCSAIQLAIDSDSPSGFSEYESYGHWVQMHKPGMIACEYFFNSPVSRRLLASNEFLEDQFGDRYRSISFQDYLDN